MNPKQRAHYFRNLWPAACAAQGWSTSDEEQRREVTRTATGQDSTKGLGELQITQLFDELKFLADPCYATALPAANPDLQRAAHEKRRIIWVIEKLPFGDAYIARVALAHTRRERVDSWAELSVESLRKIRFTLTARKRKKAAEAEGRESAPRKMAWHRRPRVRQAKWFAAGCGVPPEPHRLPLVTPDPADCPF